MLDFSAEVGVIYSRFFLVVVFVLLSAAAMVAISMAAMQVFHTFAVGVASRVT